MFKIIIVCIFWKIKTYVCGKMSDKIYAPKRKSISFVTFFNIGKKRNNLE